MMTTEDSAQVELPMCKELNQPYSVFQGYESKVGECHLSFHSADSVLSD